MHTLIWCLSWDHAFCGFVVSRVAIQMQFSSFSKVAFPCVSKIFAFHITFFHIKIPNYSNICRMEGILFGLTTTRLVGAIVSSFLLGVFRQSLVHPMRA